jgi:hypothetical protein
MGGLTDIHVENLIKVMCIICYWKPIGAPHASETMARALYWDPIPVGALFGSSSLSSQGGGPSPTKLQQPSCRASASSSVAFCSRASSRKLIPKCTQKPRLTTGPKAEGPAIAQPTMQTHPPTFQLIFRSHLHHLSISNSLRQASPRHKSEQEDSTLVIQRRIHICYFLKIALAHTATENPVANWELVHAWNLLIIIFIQDVLTLIRQS